MERTEQSVRVNEYVMNKNHTTQYGKGICNAPPTGFHCKTTFEQSNIIDVETSLRNGQQSFGVTPQSTLNHANISAPLSNSPVTLPERNLRECKSTKTISNLQNERWVEPTPRDISTTSSNDWILGVDTRQLVKYSDP